MCYEIENYCPISDNITKSKRDVFSQKTLISTILKCRRIYFFEQNGRNIDFIYIALNRFFIAHGIRSMV
jgi:hypothetical protein